jgi:WD40-like Beta Propeller Repeat
MLGNEKTGGNEEMRLMNVRKLVLGLISSLCALAGCILLWSAPAFAKEVHLYNSTFGSPGSGPGQLNSPNGIAVNSSTNSIAEPAAGDVYVVDSGNNRVERFSASGAFLGQFNGSGTYEVEGKILTGTPAPTGALSEPTQIAVDNSSGSLDPSAGDVYVVDHDNAVIDKFSPNGAYLGQLTGTPPCTVSNPCKSGGPFETGVVDDRSIVGIAVDPDGNVWVSTFGGFIYSFNDAVDNQYSSERTTGFGGDVQSSLGVDSEDNIYFDPGGNVYAEVNDPGKTLLYPFGGDESARGVAIDSKGGEVYLDDLESVEAFSFSGAQIENFGSGHMGFSREIAVDEGDGSVYVTNFSTGTVSIFEEITLPTVGIAAVSDQQPRSVVLNGTVNPEDGPVSACRFEYGTTTGYGQSVPCSPTAQELGSGSSAVAVSAHLSGLVPGATYHYRLVAEDAAQLSSVTADQELVAGPILGDESVSDVASSSATLEAPIDPNGGETSYYFEYGPSAAYGSYAPVSPPGVNIGFAPGSQSVSVHLQSLTAATSYHYRGVVVQDGEVFAGPDHTFRTESAGGSSTLPDGRTWELVSPVDKHGALFELTEDGGQVQAASNGSGITYIGEGDSPSETTAGHLQREQILSTRGPEGWTSQDLTLPTRLPENGETAELLFHTDFEYHLFSPDLSQAVVEPQEAGTPLLSPEATERTLYLRNDLDGSFSPLVSPADVPPDTPIEESNFDGVSASEWQMQFLAATPDLSHVVFSTPMALTSEAVDDETIQEYVQKKGVDGAPANLYEWGDGTLQLVNILPGDEGVAHGLSPIPRVTLAGVDAGTPRGDAPRDVSNDGRRVAWTWGAPYSSQTLSVYRGLYVRDMVEERTVRIGGKDAVYQTMNAEGSKIFYLESGDLYVYDFETGTATDLTADHGASEPNGGVQELVSDVSEDGSYVYFVAMGALAKGGVSGADNLYLLHDAASGWTTTYIATLSPEDDPDWYANNFGAPLLAEITSRVSPDGRYLAFMSNRSLTGYDNHDAVSGVPDEEVYLYDAQAGRLVCASCNPTGARPEGVSDNTQSELLVDREGTWQGKGSAEGYPRYNHWLAGSIPGWDDLQKDPATYQPRYLSDSGRLFFDSPAALVPQDTNGLEDVYEYEPEGIGNCTGATSSAAEVYVKELAGSPVGGCVGLISSGTSSTESAFYDASENGDDVFFDTTSKLVPEDVDKAYDVYDAHVCSSAVPCTTEPVPPPPCDSGDSCKAAPSPQPPIFGAPASATFSGAGNVSPVPSPEAVTKKKKTKCPATEKPRGGRCVKRKTKRRGKARRDSVKRRAKS